VPRKLTPVKWQTLQKIAAHLGFVHNRTKGDHMAFVRDGCKRPLIIPKYSPINDPRLVKSFIRTAEITQDYFLELKDRFK